MTDPASTLWLQTFLALAGLVAGLMLHLKWHPLRTHFSDAWDMLQSFAWLVPMMAALQLMSGPWEPWCVPRGVAAAPVAAIGWKSILDLLPLAAQDMAVLGLGFFPPWPAALGLPLVLTLLVWRVKRFPYRYHSRRRRPATLGALTVVVVLAWAWLGLEITGFFKPMPEVLETLRVMFRWIAEAWMMAGLQVFMIRLIIGWDEPLELDDQKDVWLALEHALSRWQGTLALAALNLLWLLALRTSGSGLTAWLLTEAALLFACVPMGVAWMRGPWMRMMDAMGRVFLASLPSLLGVAVTATVLLLLVHFSMRQLLSLVEENVLWTAVTRILIALVLATVRSWLFLTLVLTLLRQGLQVAAPLGQAKSSHHS